MAILAATIKRDRVIFRTDTPEDAMVAQRAIMGLNKEFPSPPFQHGFLSSIEGGQLVIAKKSGDALVYEELRSLVKKAESLQDMPVEEVNSLLNQARGGLDSKISLFLPSPTNCKCEFSFSYNWAALECIEPDFPAVSPKLVEDLSKKLPSKVKVFNRNNVVSLHNFDLAPLYIGREGMGVMYQTLSPRGYITETSDTEFAFMVCAFNLKSVIYLEAVQFAGVNGKVVDINNVITYPTQMGDKYFLRTLVEGLNLLCKKGDLASIKGVHLEILQKINNNGNSLDKFLLPDKIKANIQAFVMDFSAEIA